jgi:hypothetical protein
MAIDTDHLAINPFAILRGKEADHTSNVDRQTNTM